MPAQIFRQRKAKAREISLTGFFNNSGDFLLSHTVTRAVPSAPAGLTSVFWMGTGVTLPTESPENRFEISNQISDLKSQISKRDLGESNSDRQGNLRIKISNSRFDFLSHRASANLLLE